MVVLKDKTVEFLTLIKWSLKSLKSKKMTNTDTVVVSYQYKILKVFIIIGHNEYVLSNIVFLLP